MSDLRRKVAQLATDNPSMAPDLQRMLLASTSLDSRIDLAISSFMSEVIAGVSQDLLKFQRDSRGIGVTRDTPNTWSARWMTRWPGSFIETDVLVVLSLEDRQITWDVSVGNRSKGGRSTRVSVPTQISDAIWAVALKLLQKGR